MYMCTIPLIKLQNFGKIHGKCWKSPEGPANCDTKNKNYENLIEKWKWQKNYTERTFTKWRKQWDRHFHIL